MERKQGMRFWGVLAAAFAVLGLGAGLVLAHTVTYETGADITSTTSGSTGAFSFADPNP